MTGSNFSPVSTADAVASTSTAIPRTGRSSATTSDRRESVSHYSPSPPKPRHRDQDQDQEQDAVGDSASNNVNVNPNPNPRSHSRSISASSVSRHSSLASRKSRYAEPGTTGVHAESPKFSTHSPSLRSLRSPRALSSQKQRNSATSESILSEDLVLGDAAIEEPDTPRLRHGPQSETTSYWPGLPEPALTARSSLTDIQSRRLSGNSIYSLASARGVGPPTTTAAPTSDPVGRTRSASYLMSSNNNNNKAPTSTPSESGLSNVTVTTSSSAQAGTSPGNHALAPRDPHSQTLDVMRRNQRTEMNASTSTTSRSQPDRSRSRVKRRFSGSTGNSSHSPGSDRGPSHREKEEGKFPPPHQSYSSC